MSIAYKVVFDKIMEQLNKGVAPWKKSWSGSAPFNGQSKHEYRGINYWLLTAMDYKDPRWFTFRQVVNMGGKVKLGAKSVPVVFWSITEREDKLGNKKKSAFLKYYHVFNAEQCEGLKLPKLDKRSTKDNISAKAIVDGYSDKPEIVHGNFDAYYTPSKDKVSMPRQASFATDDNYYSVLFHELAHSTGHAKRLDRPGVALLDRTNISKYAEEELIAEMTAAFLSHKSGITSTIAQTASYIEGWKKYLKANPNILVSAASKAQKAADYILAETANAVAEPEESEAFLA